MSRTDVHRPYWVQLRDPANRNHVDAYHRCGPGRDGCDLDAFLTATSLPQTRCFPQYVGPRNIGCGCRMCTSHHWRRARHRSERVAWRTRRQAILALVDRDDVDVFLSLRYGE